MKPGANRQKPPLLLAITGWALLAAGLLGLVLPVIPGIPLLIAGLAILSSQHRWARGLMIWLKRRSRSAWSAMAGRRHNA